MRSNARVAQARRKLATGAEPLEVDVKAVRHGVFLSHAGRIRTMLRREYGRDRLLLLWERKDEARAWVVPQWRAGTLSMILH